MIDVAQNYTFGLPVAASSYAEWIDKSLNILHLGMAVIFFLWLAFFIYCLVRFRQGRQQQANYKGWTGHLSSFIPDGLVLAFEIWLIFFFGLPIWSHVKEEFPDPEESHLIEMSAEQFSWGFHYPGLDGEFAKKKVENIHMSNPLGIDLEDKAAEDDLVVYNELHVPFGKPTIIYMTSKDVIHSFFVPEFRVKQDVVPGMKIPLWFKPTKAGRYEIGCAQLCGLGHYVMRGEIVVHEPGEYQEWLESAVGEKKGSKPEVSEEWDL